MKRLLLPVVLVMCTAWSVFAAAPGKDREPVKVFLLASRTPTATGWFATT